MKDNKYYVYEWIRLDTNEPFYVGKGKDDRCYIKTRGNNYHFNNIVKNIPVAVNILEDNLSESEANEIECWYINEYKYIIGYNLVNITDGGEGVCGYKHLEEELKRNRMFVHGFDIEDYKNEIMDMYVNKHMSGEDIAKIYKVSDVCIMRVLRKFNVNIRTQKETIKLNSRNGIDLYNSKCVLVKNINGKVINCFETRVDCGNWLVSIGLVNKTKGGTKAISVNIDKNKGYKDLMFYSLTHDEYIKFDKKTLVEYTAKNIYINSPNYATIVEVYNKDNAKVKSFNSLKECANWIIEEGMAKSFSAGRDAIYRNMNNNKFYKSTYTFKQYNKYEYEKQIAI